MFSLCDMKMILTVRGCRVIFVCYMSSSYVMMMMIKKKKNILRSATTSTTSTNNKYNCTIPFRHVRNWKWEIITMRACSPNAFFYPLHTNFTFFCCFCCCSVSQTHSHTLHVWTRKLNIPFFIYFCCCCCIFTSKNIFLLPFYFIFHTNGILFLNILSFSLSLMLVLHPFVFCHFILDIIFHLSTHF